jgi:predicted CXXCH cytochrome family protein
MKLKLPILCTLLGIASLAVSGAPLPKSGVTGTKHDIGSAGCKGCHAPHNGSIANGGTDGSTGKILLWSRNFPAAANTFGVYDSATMVNKATELGGSALSTSTDVRMYSLLCLSCHDGVTSSFSPAMQTVNMVGSKAAFGAGAYESFGLTNDHPVNISHDPTKNTSLRAVATVVTSMPLFGTGNSIQCATCHEPHNNTNTSFLRVNPANSAVCTTCHL